MPEQGARRSLFDQWVSLAGLATVLAVICAIATLNSLHIADSFMDTHSLEMATSLVARAVWWLVWTVLATGAASVLWARRLRPVVGASSTNLAP